LQICHRFAFFDEPRRHEVTKSRDNSTFVSSCLCGGTDLWKIYGGAKGVNPTSMLDRVCNGLVRHFVRPSTTINHNQPQLVDTEDFIGARVEKLRAWVKSRPDQVREMLSAGLPVGTEKPRRCTVDKTCLASFVPAPFSLAAPPAPSTFCMASCMRYACAGVQEGLFAKFGFYRSLTCPVIYCWDYVLKSDGFIFGSAVNKELFGYNE